MLLGAAGLGCRETVRDTAPAPAPATPLEAAVVASRAQADAGDTVVVQVRLARAPGVPAPGSFTLRLGYDVTRLHFVDEVPNGEGMLRAVNAEIPGELRVAGAAPGGFLEPGLVTLRLAARTSGPLGALRLTVDQMSTTDGTASPDVVVRPMMIDPAVRP